MPKPSDIKITTTEVVYKKFSPNGDPLAGPPEDLSLIAKIGALNFEGDRENGEDLHVVGYKPAVEIEPRRLTVELAYRRVRDSPARSAAIGPSFVDALVGGTEIIEAQSGDSDASDDLLMIRPNHQRKARSLVFVALGDVVADAIESLSGPERGSLGPTCQNT